MSLNRISAAEAASLIKHGYNIGLSGFTPAGTAKAVTAELAKIAEAEHAKGNPFQVGIFTGASTGESCDGVMSRAKAIRYRAPYTTNSDFRKAVNNGEIAYNDIHLSQMAQEVRYGFMGMDVLANLVNMAKAQGLYTIVDARTAAPAVYVEGGIRADGVTVTPYPGSDVCRVGEDKSVFAAVRTGNPSAPEIQNLLSGDRRLYLAAADQMVRHGAALMAETDYVLDVKELRSRAPKAFLLLLGCDGENALPAFDDYGGGALIADTALQYADADAVQAAVRQLKQLVTVL